MTGLITRSVDPEIEAIRQRLQAGLPRRRFHPARVTDDGPWNIDEAVPKALALRILISGHTARDGSEWLHVSMSRIGVMPTHEDMKLVHAAVWPNGHAYQVFVPPAEHYNYHEHCLHLWGRPDGSRALPDFRSETGAV